MGMAACAFSVQAGAVGLSDIKISSALNQPLDAQVQLLDVGNLPLNNIKVRLATSEEFTKVGVEREGMVGELEFQVVRDKAGKVMILITTDKPLDDPIISFLMEVASPSGRMLRQYTVFLDPADYERPKVVIPASAETYINKQATLPQPTMFAGQQQQPSETATTAWQEPVAKVPTANTWQEPKATQKQEPQVLQKPNVRQPSGASTSAISTVTKQESRTLHSTAENTVTTKTIVTMKPETPAVEFQERYGPVTSQDTLWKIALKYSKQGQVTPQQAMLAIYSSNPKAFAHHNPNGLMTGFVLRIPAQTTMATVSQASALKQIRQWHQEWVAEHSSPHHDHPHQPMVEKSLDAVHQPHQGMSLPVAATTPETPELPKQALSSEPVITDKATELATKEQKKQATPIALSTESFSPLESLLMPEIGDSTIESEKPGLQATLAIIGEKLAKEQQQNQVLQEQILLLQQQNHRLQESLTEEQGAEKEREAISETAIASHDALVHVLTEPDLQATAEKSDVIATKKEISIYFAELKSKVRLILIGLLALLAGIFGLFYLNHRRYKKQQQDFHFEPIDDELLEDAKVVSRELEKEEEQPIRIVAAVDESEELADEVDVFIAYGRYSQAESILEAALKNNPEQPNLLIKLLEVNSLMGEKQKFSANVQRLPNNFADNEPGLWNKITRLQSAFAETTAEEELEIAEDMTTVLEEAFPTTAVAKQEMLAAEESTLTTELITEKKQAEPEDPEVALETEEKLQAEQLKSDSKGVEDDKLETEKENTLEFQAVDWQRELPPEQSLKEEGNLIEFSMDDEAAEPDENEALDAAVGFSKNESLATKLDLARVYIDMGDNEEARRLLNEIIQSGEGKLKASAKDLLQQISK